MIRHRRGRRRGRRRTEAAAACLNLEELEIADVGGNDVVLQVGVIDAPRFHEREEILVDVSPSHPGCPPGR